MLETREKTPTGWTRKVESTEQSVGLATEDYDEAIELFKYTSNALEDIICSRKIQ